METAGLGLEANRGELHAKRGRIPVRGNETVHIISATYNRVLQLGLRMQGGGTNFQGTTVGAKAPG